MLALLNNMTGPGAIKDFALDLIFPKICAVCKLEGSFLCAGCAGKLIIMSPSCPICRKRDIAGKICSPCRAKTVIRRFYAPFTYRNEEVRNLIRVYKYESAKELAGALAGFMAAAMQKANFAAKKNMLVIPIPLHWRKERERGFNQAALLARNIGNAFGIPVLEKTLVRTRGTSAQIELENDMFRRKNIAGSFAVANTDAIAKKTIILIDDVYTSGATINEAAGVLKSAGAKSIWAAVVACR